MTRTGRTHPAPRHAVVGRTSSVHQGASSARPEDAAQRALLASRML